MDKIEELRNEFDRLTVAYNNLLEDAERFRSLARTMADERDAARATAGAWRAFTIEPDGTDATCGVQVVCRRENDDCEWAKANQTKQYLTLGEAVDASQEHAAWHAKNAAAAGS